MFAGCFLILEVQLTSHTAKLFFMPLGKIDIFIAQPLTGKDNNVFYHRFPNVPIFVIMSFLHNFGLLFAFPTWNN